MPHSLNYTRSLVARSHAKNAESEELEELRTENEDLKRQLRKAREKLSGKDKDTDGNKQALARSNRRLVARAAALGLNADELRREVRSGARSEATGLAAIPEAFRRAAGIGTASTRTTETRDGGLYLNVVSTEDAKAHSQKLRTQRERLGL